MSKPKEGLEIIGICGSLREGSYTRMALAVALQGAQDLGAATRIIDLHEYNLVFNDGRKTPYPAGVLRLRSEVRQAQGILLGSPEYHAGMSGVLKNALDLMGFDEFGGKMLGLVGVSGGVMGAANALSSLRAVGRSLHAWVVPEQVSIPEAWKVFSADGQLLNEDYRQRLMEVGRQVARFAYLHSSQEARAFLNLWEAAPSNPGG